MNKKDKNIEKEDFFQDFNDEVRAITRDVNNLSPDKRKLLHSLISTMIQSGDDALIK